MENTRRSPKPAKSRSRSRKHPADLEPRSAPEYLWVGAVGGWVAPFLCIERPLIAQLVAEDACWRMMSECWRGGRPAWWHVTARSAWNAEGALLEEKKDRLKDQALGLGIRPAPPTPKKTKKAQKAQQAQQAQQARKNKDDKTER